MILAAHIVKGSHCTVILLLSYEKFNTNCGILSVSFGSRSVFQAAGGQAVPPVGWAARWVFHDFMKVSQHMSHMMYTCVMLDPGPSYWPLVGKECHLWGWLRDGSAIT